MSGFDSLDNIDKKTRVRLIIFDSLIKLTRSMLKSLYTKFLYRVTQIKVPLSIISSGETYRALL